MLTEDKHLKSRVIELVALIQAKTHVFIVRPRKGMTNPQKAEAIVIARDAMIRLIEHRDPPICASITPSGRVSEIEDWNTLVERYHALKSN